MVRKVNKGVSMVEILIALAIFMVMLMPIVSSVISSMKMTTSAKELQYRNEYAQNLMENLKEVPFSDLTTGYFESMGADGVTVSTTASSGYEIKGKTYIGKDQTEYACAIGIENYATKPLSGNVENLDQNKVAMIDSSSLANYDTMAEEALRARKIIEYEKANKENGKKYEPGVSFKNDTGNRIVKVIVKKSAAGYDVTCKLTYSDNSPLPSKDDTKTIGEVVGELEYVLYQKQFQELPNIYLLHNVCVYNDLYAKEYITFDLSGVTEDVNVFIVESEVYRKTDTDRKASASVGMAITNTSDEEKLHVYHGIDDVRELKYDDTVLVPDKSGVSYKKLKDVNVKDLTDVKQTGKEERKLYEIKIWLQKGDIVDMSKDPVLIGTRGGD